MTPARRLTADGTMRARQKDEEDRVLSLGPAGLPAPGSDGNSSDQVARVRQPGELPSYRVRDDALEMGASLGNSRCWVNTRGNGSIESIFSIERGVGIASSIS